MPNPDEMRKKKRSHLYKQSKRGHDRSRRHGYATEGLMRVERDIRGEDLSEAVELVEKINNL